MQVTMATNPPGTHAGFVYRAEPLHNLRFKSYHPFGLRLKRRGKLVEAESQQIEILNGEIAHRLKQRALIERSKWFRSKIAVLRVGSKGRVQLACALPE